MRAYGAGRVSEAPISDGPFHEYLSTKAYGLPFYG